MQPSSRAGFALVDLLIALAIAGLIAASLMGLISFLERQRQVSREQRHDAELTAAGERILRSLVEGVAPAVANDPSGPTAEGTADHLSLRSWGPPVLALARPVRFTLQSEPDRTRRRLILSWRDPDTGRVHRESVAEEIAQASFSYFGLVVQERVRRWQAAWDARTGPLEAVAMRLSVSNEARASTLVIPLRPTLPQSCARDHNLPGCSGS